MFREDVFYACKDIEQIATKKLSERYTKFSERFNSWPVFKGLKIDQETQVCCNDTKEVVSLKELIELFKSKDFEAYDEYKKKYLEDGELRFLDGEPVGDEKVAYWTFGRSGNTFLRRYIELVTGVPTGSEMPVSSFQMSGMLGENVVDDTCWVIKTHHPMPKFPGTKEFAVQKVIVCVRNPFDVIMSNYNFTNSNFAHSATVENDPFAPENADYINEVIQNKTKELKKFQEHVFEALIKNEVPFYFLKFE